MKILLLVLVVIIVIIKELISIAGKKQHKEAAVLLMLGAISVTYGYYYITHEHTASFANLIFDILSAK